MSVVNTYNLPQMCLISQNVCSALRKICGDPSVHTKRRLGDLCQWVCVCPRLLAFPAATEAVQFAEESGGDQDRAVS